MRRVAVSSNGVVLFQHPRLCRTLDHFEGDVFTEFSQVLAGGFIFASMVHVERTAWMDLWIPLQDQRDATAYRTRAVSPKLFPTRERKTGNAIIASANSTIGTMGSGSGYWRIEDDQARYLKPRLT